MATQLKHITHAAPVAVATTTTVALAPDPDRVWVLLVNDSDTTIYLAFNQAAVVGQGIRLNAEGGSLELSYETGFIDSRQINAIHGDTGTKNLLVTYA